MLVPFSMTLDNFEVDFDIRNRTNVGTPLDFRAFVSSKLTPTDTPKPGLIRVNEPLEMPDANVFLTGNGYAPYITIRDAKGNQIFAGANAFLPQDSNYTSLGIIKVPDVERQFGIIAFFYPTAQALENGALTSIYPAPVDPLLTLNVYEGDLGLDEGISRNVYALDTSGMTQVAGGKAEVRGLQLKLGETVQLPNGLGSVTFEEIRRFASLDFAYNPGGIWVLLFSLLALAGVTTSLLTPRRRVWVRQTSGGFEVAALARGDDPALTDIVQKLVAELKGKKINRKGSK
jgi:cytochrome c biogenesis protein